MRKTLKEDGHNQSIMNNLLFDVQNAELMVRTKDKFLQKQVQRNVLESELNQINCTNDPYFDATKTQSKKFPMEDIVDARRFTGVQFNPQKRTNQSNIFGQNQQSDSAYNKKSITTKIGHTLENSNFRSSQQTSYRDQQRRFKNSFIIDGLRTKQRGTFDLSSNPSNAAADIIFKNTSTLNSGQGKRSLQGNITKENATIVKTMADSVTDEPTGDNISAHMRNYRSVSQNEDHLVSSTVQSVHGNQTMEAMPVGQSMQLQFQKPIVNNLSKAINVFADTKIHSNRRVSQANVYPNKAGKTQVGFGSHIKSLSKIKNKKSLEQFQKSWRPGTIWGQRYSLHQNQEQINADLPKEQSIQKHHYVVKDQQINPTVDPTVETPGDHTLRPINMSRPAIEEEAKDQTLMITEEEERKSEHQEFAFKLNDDSKSKDEESEVPKQIVKSRYKARKAGAKNLQIMRQRKSTSQMMRLDKKSIFRRQSQDVEVPSKKISQIINLKSSDVKYTMNTASIQPDPYTESAQISFRQDNAANVMNRSFSIDHGRTLSMKPISFKKHRRSFAENLRDYEKQKCNTHYFEDSKNVILSVPPHQHKNYQFKEPDRGEAAWNSLAQTRAQGFNDTVLNSGIRQNHRIASQSLSDFNLDGRGKSSEHVVNQTNFLSPYLNHSGSNHQAQNGFQNQSVMSKDRKSSNLNLSYQLQSKSQIELERNRGLTSILLPPQMSPDNPANISNNQSYGPQQFQVGLHNIESIQNMRRSQNVSQTSQRRTLQSQQNDETNTLFQTQLSSMLHGSKLKKSEIILDIPAKVPYDQNGSINQALLQNVHSMDLRHIRQSEDEEVPKILALPKSQAILNTKLDETQRNYYGQNLTFGNEHSFNPPPMEQNSQEGHQRVNARISFENVDHQTQSLKSNNSHQKLDETINRITLGGRDEQDPYMSENLTSQEPHQTNIIMHNYGNVTFNGYPQVIEQQTFGPNTNMGYRQFVKRMSQQKSSSQTRPNQRVFDRKFDDAVIEASENQDNLENLIQEAKQLLDKDENADLKVNQFIDRPPRTTEENFKYWEQQYDKGLRKANFLKNKSQVENSAFQASPNLSQVTHHDANLRKSVTFKVEQGDTNHQNHEVLGSLNVTKRTSLPRFSQAPSECSDEYQNILSENRSSPRNTNPNSRIEIEMTRSKLNRMDDSKRSVFESKLRDKKREEIEQYIDLPFNDPRTKNFAGHPDLNIKQLEGADCQLKYNMVIKNFYNKLDAVADDIIQSYTWEAERDMIIPEDPKGYRGMVMEQLDVTEDELIKLFVEHLELKAKEYVPPNNRQSKEKLQRDLRYQSQIRDEDPESTLREKIFRASTQSIRLTTESDGGQQPRRSSQKSVRSKNSSGQNMNIQRSNTLSSGYSKKQRELFFKNLIIHQERLLDEYYEVTKTIQTYEMMQQGVYDKRTQMTTGQVFDANLEKAMVSSEVNDQVGKVIHQKQAQEELEMHAAEITAQLKEKSKAKRDQYLVSQKKLSDASLLHRLFGKSRDAMVLKFIEIIKRKVQERKDLNTKQATENFIKEILKTLEFNKSLKNTYQVKQKNQKKAVRMTIEQIVKKKMKERVKAQQIEEELQEIYDTEGNYNQLNQKPGKKINEKNLYSQKSRMRQNLSSHLAGMMTSNSKKTTINSYNDYDFESDEADTVSIDSHIDNLPEHERKRAIIEKKLTIKRSKQHELQQSGKQDSIIKDVLETFVKSSMEQGEVPLPILKRIQERYFPLINYQVNDANARSLAKVLVKGVPTQVNKLYLINNSLKDKAIGGIIYGLSQTDGLQGLGVISNNFEIATYETIASQFIPSKSFKALKKFILKDPNPARPQPTSMFNIFESLKDNSHRITNLRVLTLSRLGFDKNSVKSLAEAVVLLSCLEQLDISGNNIQPLQMTRFIETIHGENNLKSLNISFNNCNQILKEAQDDVPVFDEIFSEFLHVSTKLVHLDISGTNLKIDSLLTISQYGFRKSRTLQSIHICDMELLNDDRIQLREALRVVSLQRDQEFNDDRISLRRQVAHIDKEKVKDIFHSEESQKNKDFLATALKKGQTNAKDQLKKRIKMPAFGSSSGDQLIFQRHLGHPEMPDSHRWVESSVHNCYICNKASYTLFIWNKKVGYALLDQQTGASKKKGKAFMPKFYNHSMIEPIQFSDTFQNDPVLAINGQIKPMIPLTEFFERLIWQQQNNVRNCDNEIEEERYKTIKSHIKEDVKLCKNLESTYWQFRKKIDPKKYKKFNESEVSGWPTKLQKLLPKDTVFPINLQAFSQFMDKAYVNTHNKYQAIAQETFFLGAFIPSNETDCDVVIKCREIQGVNYLRFGMNQSKHLSINTMNAPEKRVRKVKEIRHFVFKTSVFKNFKGDDKAVIDAGFESDKTLCKIPRFVKDEEDREKTFEVIRKYYPQLKNQFLSQISSPKSYPVIDWLDFVEACNAQFWNLVDSVKKDLTAQDIDRIFIATNFEEEDLEENDDNSLCRFEFLEIIARMAKCKYFEKGVCKTVAESVEKLVVDFIIPNSIEIMEWQPFRDNQLWTLEVDDFFKANQYGIEQLYKKYATGILRVGKSFTKDDSMKMMAEAAVPITEKNTVVAYALSKSTIANEMEQFDKYNQMNMSEFYEFLGRSAALLHTDNVTLDKKIDRLLQILLPSIGIAVKPVDLEANIPSDSDCDDDWVDEITQKLLGNFPKEGDSDEDQEDEQQ